MNKICNTIQIIFLISLSLLLQQSQCFLTNKNIPLYQLSGAEFDPTQNCLQSKKQNDINPLISEIKVTISQFQDSMIQQIQNRLNKSDIQFSSDQVVRIFDKITISQTKQKVLATLSSKFDSLSTQDVVDCMNSESEIDTQNQLFQSLTEYLHFNDEKASQYLIQNSGFTLAQQQNAQNVLQNIKPKKCLQTEEKPQVVGYLIDISDSMNKYIKLPNGQNISLLDQAKIQLKAMLQDLSEDQSFGIIAYNTFNKSFKSSAVKASNYNKESALRWVDRLSLFGIPDVLSAIRDAYKQFQGLESLQILSSGNIGVFASSMEITYTIENLNKNRNPPVKMNTICLVASGSGCQTLKKISEQTNGEYQDISNLK